MVPIASVDFETDKIEQRPDYPPAPVGVAITEPNMKSKYWAFGHPTENNCTRAQARKELLRVYNKYQIVYHNAKFDLDVGETHLDIPYPKHGIHDTEFLAFLNNPHETNLKLKPLAETYLDMPPEERDAVAEWVQEHVFLSKSFKTNDYEVRIESGKPKGWYKVPPTKTGAFICYTPGKLAGRYACGDTDRTLKLFNLFYRNIKDNGMQEAYERELKLLPILLGSEREGIKIAYARLQKDAATWDKWIGLIDNYLRKVLNSDFDVDSNEELADALEAAGKVDEWVYTDKGNRSTSKDNVETCVNDQSLLHVLNYRSKLVNSYRNFGRPWLTMADRSNGWIFTNWNQVRKASANGKDSAGARTGRLSSNPNFQNVPKKPAIIVDTQSAYNKLLKDGTDSILLPRSLLKSVGQLPILRDYITPDGKGHTLLNRDYSQQELRILGHFEDAVLLDAYLKDPNLDVHELARTLINKMLGTNIQRKPIKNLGFGLIYGMGLGKLAVQMGVDVTTAKKIRDAYLAIFPGLGELTKSLKSRGKNKEPIRTWGGRLYYVEPPKLIQGRIRTFEYKLLNVLIQGSAADCTKQAVINYYDIRKEGRLLLSVHDELMIDSPTKAAKREMQLLREAMADVNFDVKMLSDGKSSTVSWGRMKPWKEAA